MRNGFEVVTGGFGYSGKYLTRRLLAAGRRVRTLTTSKARAFGDRVEVRPLDFGDLDGLVESLRGADVLFNTYWVRFNHRTFNHAEAVENTLRLFEAAKRAGVRRVVHVSITNPSEGSPFEYFRGKARLERALRESGMSYAIVRPAVLFGGEDILVNNITWVLRRFPVFGVFGDGRYRIRPIHVEDFAALLERLGESSEDVTVDAVGPESFEYRELVAKLGECVGRPRRLVRIPAWLGCATGRAIGAVVKDVVITREEIGGLMADLLYTPAPAVGTTRLTEWARANAATLGTRYASELARRRAA